MNLIEKSFAWLAFLIGCLISIHFTARFGVFAWIFGVPSGFLVVQVGLKVLDGINYVWLYLHPLRPSCKTGRCKVMDYYSQGRTGKGVIFKCNCGDLYYRRKGRFFEMVSETQLKPYMKRNWHGAWVPDPSPDLVTLKPDPKPGWEEGTIHYSKIRFWGEQDGPRERKMKAELANFFRTRVEVKAAYLAKMGQGDDGPPDEVALCVKTLFASAKDVVEINRKIGDVYAAIFPIGEKIQTVHIDEQREVGLTTICRPFYEDANRLDRPPNLALTVRVCQHVAAKQHDILNAIHAEPHEEGDSGWRFFCRSGENEDPARGQTITMRELLGREIALVKLLNAPVGTVLWRPSVKSAWQDLVRSTKTQPAGIANSEGEQSAEPAADDSLRQYLKLRAGDSPVGDHLYYECYSCGDVVESLAKTGSQCRCGNFSVSRGTGRIVIRDEAKIRVFKQS
jgi:hypothetical protein